jgi:hypothetical protein
MADEQLRRLRFALDDKEDLWNADNFEDEISRAVVSVYETKLDPTVKKVQKVFPMETRDIQAIRRHGLYIPAKDREILLSDNHHVNRMVTEIASLPLSGCISHGEDRHAPGTDRFDTYCHVTFFRRVLKLPKNVIPIAAGVPYELMDYYPQDTGGAEGFRTYMTINPKTHLITPTLRTGGNQPLSAQIATRMADPDMSKMEGRLNANMQYMDDMQHTWRITAISAETKVTIGAYAENVKSLLYARSLPVTGTGRKRPILHAVQAHRRRMKSGIDIDIKPFLRGITEVEMDGAKFIVEAPQRLITEYLNQE